MSVLFVVITPGYLMVVLSSAGFAEVPRGLNYQNENGVGVINRVLRYTVFSICAHQRIALYTL